ncbi:oligosaccharide flippase family protein [Rhodococcus ruber]|nr:oligosaccharide flippase family protein [Rhodococcus ruber]
MNPAVGLMTGPVLARMLGPNGRGELAALLQPLTMADSVAALGVPTAIVYFLNRGNPSDRTMKIAYSVVAVSSLTVYLCLAWYAGILTSDSQLPESQVLLLWTTVIVGALASCRRAQHAAAANWAVLDAERATSAILRLTTVLGLAGFGITSSTLYATAYLGAGILAYGVLLYPTQSSANVERHTVGLSEFLRFAWVSAAAAVAMTASARLDQIMLPISGSMEELGYYSVAVTVAEIPMIAAAVGARNILTDATQGHTTLSALRRATLPILTCAAASTLGAILARPAIPVLFGPQFNGAVAPTVVLCIGTIFGGITAIAVSYLAGIGRPAWSSVSYASGIALTLLCFGWGWRRIDAVDAAIIATAAQMVTATTAILFMRRAHQQTLRERTAFGEDAYE